MGKNNLLLALKELQSEGILFNLTYSRGPFFLMGSQANIDASRREKGLPLDAPNNVVWPRKEGAIPQIELILVCCCSSSHITAPSDSDVPRRGAFKDGYVDDGRWAESTEY